MLRAFFSKNIGIGKHAVLVHMDKDNNKTDKSPLSQTRINPCLDANSVFLKHIGSLLYCAHLAGARVTLNAAKNTLVNDAYRLITRNVMWYACYDLATQENACTTHKNSLGGLYTYVAPNILMRFVAFAFACSLSSSQRKSVIELLSDKIAKNEAKSNEMDRFLRLLQMIDAFRQYLDPKARDSHYMPIVDGAVGLFTDIVSKKQKSTSSSRTLSLIMLLEAKFLLQIAKKSHEILLGRKTIGSELATLCTENAQKIHNAHGRLCSEIDSVLCGKKHSISKEILNSALSEIKVFRSGGQGSANAELMSGMSALLSRVKYLVEGYVDTVSQNLDPQETMDLAMAANNVAAVESSVKLGLQSNKPIVDNVYDMIISSSADHSVESLAKKEIAKMAYLQQQHIFPSGVLCSGTVAYHTKKFINDLQSSKNYRGPGNLEQTNIKIMLDALDECATLNTNPCSITQEAKNYRAVFERLVKNIFVSIASGDICKVFGEDSRMINMNYRVLSLYINMFCNLPPDVMKSALVDLKEFFEECGGEIPSEMRDVLCLLIDLKYFSYKSSYTGSAKDHDNDCYKYNSYYNKNGKTAVSILTTLAKLTAYSACSNKNNKASYNIGKQSKSCSVDLSDIVKVLLYECELTMDIASELDCENSKKHKKWAYRQGRSKNAHRISEVLYGRKLETIENLVLSNKKISSKINESVENMRDMLLERLNHAETHGGKDSLRLNSVANDLLDKIWDAKTDGDVSCNEVDKQLSCYMLARSYTTGKHALHLVSACKYVQSSGVYPLEFVLDVYFRSNKTQSDRTTSCDSTENSNIQLPERPASGHKTTGSQTYNKKRVSYCFDADRSRNPAQSCAAPRGSVPQILGSISVDGAMTSPPPRASYRTEVCVMLR